MKRLVLIVIAAAGSLGLGATTINAVVTHLSNGECNGSINLTVTPTGGEGPFSYLWDTGSTYEDLYGLCPGDYAVTVTDAFGCTSEREYSIVGCVFDEVLNPTIVQTCRVFSSLGSIDLNVELPPGTSLIWIYRTRAGSSILPQTSTAIYELTFGLYCVSIICDLTGEELAQECYNIGIVGECPEPEAPERPPVIINEASNGTYFLREYYELLVLGEGTGDCENVEEFDLRGFIVDDNNNDFSKENENSSFIPQKDAGFAAGHIRFKNHQVWSDVPVGSIVLIYNDAHRNMGQVIDKANRRYIIPISSYLLEGSLVQPSLTTSTAYLPGSTAYFPASWDAIPLYNPSDSPQVRFPDGRYCHGISYGPSSRMTGGPHDLKITSQSGLRRVFYLLAGNYLSKFGYGHVSLTAVSTAETPGAPNNPWNEFFINQVCGGLHAPDETNNLIVSPLPDPNPTASKEAVSDVLASTGLRQKLDVAVYPNPTSGIFTAEVSSTEAVRLRWYLLDVLGKRYATGTQRFRKGQTSLPFDKRGDLVDGVYFLVFQDEETKAYVHTHRIVYANN